MSIVYHHLPALECLFYLPVYPKTVKRMPTMWETRVQSLGREDLLEKEMATHSSIRAWKIPWMEEPGRLQSMGSQRAGHDSTTSLHLSKSTFPECFVHVQ